MTNRSENYIPQQKQVPEKAIIVSALGCDVSVLQSFQYMGCIQNGGGTGRIQ